MSGRKLDVRVVSIETDFRAPSSEHGEVAKVVFRVRAGAAAQWDLPVYVLRTHFDDDNLIPVARDHLHRLLRNLSDQTQEWEMPKEELERRQRPGKPDRKTDPT